ncbi:rCG59311 [Rattus norvegicus]|uniref:RCG59311 n=1 Tax=Rattus norvegicus TaxID=10116 RepID=A6K7S0_RAT|nr:rCG59311 [Rattus norvegicus]
MVKCKRHRGVTAKKKQSLLSRAFPLYPKKPTQFCLCSLFPNVFVFCSNQFPVAMVKYLTKAS